MSKALSIRNVSKQYTIGAAEKHTTLASAAASFVRNPFRRTPTQTFNALTDVTFDVTAGQAVALIGRNGAGKSTLLKILSRITEPTTGTLELFGRIGSLLEVGTGFHPELTGRENVFLNGSILGMRRGEIARQFDAIVAFAEIEKFIDTPVKRYSSGMYVRLAFAVAAHLNPEILIVDEVLAVGDAGFQKKCLGKMGEVGQQGRTVLFVSHNMGAVRSLCQHAVWLDKGRMREQGDANVIVDKYLREMLDEAAVSIPLGEHARASHLGNELKLTRIEFNAGNPIYHGQPLDVRLNWESSTDTTGVSFGFGIATLDGVRLLSVDSDLQQPRFDLVGVRSGVVTARIPRLDLQPGRYSLDVGARSGDFAPLDYLGSVAQLEILPGPTTPGTIIREGGGVRTPADWKWHSPAVASTAPVGQTA